MYLEINKNQKKIYIIYPSIHLPNHLYVYLRRSDLQEKRGFKHPNARMWATNLCPLPSLTLYDNSTFSFSCLPFLKAWLEVGNTMPEILNLRWMRWIYNTRLPQALVLRMTLTVKGVNVIESCQVSSMVFKSSKNQTASWKMSINGLEMHLLIAAISYRLTHRLGKANRNKK